MKLEDYGFISDMHSGALVGRNGSIDWLCLPRFGSEACFAALLGTEKNGHWQIAPKEEAAKAMQAYRGETLVLETTFETVKGRVRLVDFMPPRGQYGDVVRMVEGVSGNVEMEMCLIVRFDFGQTVPWVRKPNGGLHMVAGPNAVAFHGDVPTTGEDMTTVARFSVGEGERKCFVMTWYPSHEDAPAEVDPLKALEETESFWKEWVGCCTYKGKWRDAVVRSLITLKGLIYAPTGGIMAALTTSLPEKLGGERNWDYRFCWLRDATLTLFSMMHSGYTEEAAAWSRWLLRAVAGEAKQLQIMYGAAGERRLTEIDMKHLPGYENSRPVRVGNAATEQFQLDVYGEIMGAMHLTRVMKIGDEDCTNWRLQRHLVDFVEENWTKPDEGIWEVRGPRRHFTHSKVMAWLAMDRAVKGVEEFGLEGDVERWRATRQAIHDEVCEKGYNAEVGAFTQFYGSQRLDAALLMIPLVGFLPATDERVISTVDLIQKKLMREGYVQRYHPEKSEDVDGLPPGEGAFLPCTFWLAANLHLMGREAEALELFERVLEVRTPLGLLSEEYDTEAKRLVGNFPQAFSHVSLVNCARILSQPPPKSGMAEHKLSATK